MIWFKYEEKHFSPLERLRYDMGQELIEECEHNEYTHYDTLRALENLKDEVTKQIKAMNQARRFAKRRTADARDKIKNLEDRLAKVRDHQAAQNNKQRARRKLKPIPA